MKLFFKTLDKASVSLNALLLYRRRRMDNCKNGKPCHVHEAGIQHNPAYETNSVPNDKSLSNGNRCPDAVTDDNGHIDYNNIFRQATNDYQNPHDDATYNHIINGPTRAIIIDKTYAHIPNTAAARLDNTYSHLPSKENRYEQNNVNEPEDSTYNHLGLSDPSSYLSGRNNNRQIRDKTNSRKDDTYSHINPNYKNATYHQSNAGYEDSTYNHIGDNRVQPTTKSIPCGQRANTLNKVTASNNEKKQAVAGRYDYAFVNKPPQTATSSFPVDDAPHDYFVLEQHQDTRAIAKTQSNATQSTSVEDGPHKYYVLEPI